MALVPYTGAQPNRDYRPNPVSEQTSSLDMLTAPERKQAYIGLQNQGATCYLNSFVQSLYMTSEFR